MFESEILGDDDFYLVRIWDQNFFNQIYWILLLFRSYLHYYSRSYFQMSYWDSFSGFIDNHSSKCL